MVIIWLVYNDLLLCALGLLLLMSTNFSHVGKYWINSLTTVGYLLRVFFRLWISFLVRISTSAWSQHWKLEPGFFDTISYGS